MIVSIRYLASPCGLCHTLYMYWFADVFSHAYMQRTLEREIRGCQHLILWTDGDREGENIADEIVEVITQGTD